MANKKISELSSRTPALSDLMLVGDPSSGYSYKCTITALSTIVETAIGGNYVTLATTQTISGAKTFSNIVTLTSVANSPTAGSKFLILNASNVVNYRTAAEVLSDIGAQAAGSYVPTTRSLTINGTAYDLSADRTWSVGTVISVAATAGTGISISGSPITSSGTLTITNTAPDQTVVLTAGTGISVSGTYPNFTITNSSPSSGGTVTSVAALTIGTTGTDLSSSVANSTTTPVITLNVPTASATNRGALSSTDWTTFNNKLSAAVTSLNGLTASTQTFATGTSGTDFAISSTTSTHTFNLPTASATNRGALSSTDWSTFNNKQNTLTLTTTGTSGAATLVGATLNIPQYQSVLTNPVTGTGTTNYVSKFTSSSAIGNSQIFDNGTNVGVGVSNPGSYNGFANKLVVGGTPDAGITIVGDPSEGTSNLYLADGTTGDQAYRGFLSYAHSNDALAIGTSGTTKMTLNSSGNLGLGLTPNSWGAGQVAFEYGTLGTLVSTGSAVSLQNNSYNNGTNNIRKVIGEASSYTQSGGAHIWQTAASGTTGSTISFSEVMRISSGGNLGLGVTPSAWGSIFNAIEIGRVGDGIFAGSGGGTIVTANAYFGTSNWIYARSAAAANYDLGSGQHRWYIAPSGTAGNVISFTQAMTLNASGRLLIGGTSDNGLRLQVTGDIYANNEMYLDNGKYLRFQRSSGGLSIQTLGIPSGTDDVRLVTTGDFNVVNGSLTNLMTVKNGGNVGIGTTSPAVKLDVNGDINLASGYTLSWGGAYGANIPSIAGVSGVGSNIRFYPSGSTTGETMRITSGGNVGIGTSSPAAKLQVSGGSIRLDDGQALEFGGSTNFILGDNTNNLFRFYTNNSERMRITAGGEVYIAGTTDQGAYNLQVNGTGVWGAGAYVNGSDSALKQNIQPLDNSLDLVKQMKPVTYTYKDFYSKDTSVQTGFIAQDLQVLLKDKNYLDGIVKQGPQYMSVAYQNIIPLLVKAIQEQQIEIDNLKNK